MLEQIAFYSISAIIVGGAIAMVASRRLVRSVIWMVVSFIGVACLFLLLQAEFLFAVQILVYAGGIVVLFLFVIMLVNLSDFEQIEYLHHQWLPALLLVTLILAEVGFLLWAGALGTPAPDEQLVDVALRGMGGNIETIGQVLYTEYLLPFEVVSMLLLVALVGAIYLAKKRV